VHVRKVARWYEKWERKCFNVQANRHIVVMGNPDSVCGPFLEVAVQYVAETVTQAQNHPRRVISEMRSFIKIMS
jgi:hypothetical protein